MNRQRGEVALEIDGTSRRLCLTLGALAEIEAALGCDTLSDLSARLQHLSARDMVSVLSALLRGGGETDLAVRIGDLPVPPGHAASAIAEAFRAGFSQ